MSLRHYFTDIDEAIGFTLEEVCLHGGRVIVDLPERGLYDDFFCELQEAAAMHADPCDLTHVSWIHAEERDLTRRVSAVVVLR